MTQSPGPAEQGEILGSGPSAGPVKQYQQRSAWGGHVDCPGTGIRGQLPAILKRAKELAAK